MRSIPLLPVEAIDIFDEIALAKHQPRQRQMQAARKKIVSAYQRYHDTAPNIGGLDAALLTDLQKEAMRHAYNVETGPMTTLRADLLKRISVARCPFCGIGETSTLDHYLPKEHYPEYSVFPNNLVPSCAACNTRKRDLILDEETNVRIFLHPCYDVIPELEFLMVQTRMEDDALILSYRLSRPAGMAIRTFQHLQGHYKKLNLPDRYRRMGLEHLGEQYPSLRRAYGGDGDAERVAEKLLEKAEDFEELSGPNYWLAKLYRSLANNPDFCDGGFHVVRPPT